jgi:hypothetical protein
MSTTHKPQPDSDGWVTLSTDGEKDARYHPERREIEVVKRRKRRVYPLRNYE